VTARPPLIWPRMAWPLELTIIVIGDLLYERVRAFAPARSALAFANADRLLSLEPAAIERFEGWLNGLDASHHPLAVGSGYYYYTLHLPVTAAILVWLWWRRPQAYPVARSALLVMTYGALVFFWLFPVAPPRLVTPGAFDTLAALHLGTEPGQTHGLVNQYAAFPSLHVAWAFWCAWALLVTARSRWRWLALLYPVLTSFVVVATANHYLIDVLAGLAAFGLAVAVLPSARPYRRSVTTQPAETLADITAV
jgi:membrane-associated phospholipid phosphatase